MPIADTDVDIDDFDDFDLLAAEIRIIGVDVRDLLAITGSLPFGIVAQAYNTADRRPQAGRSGLPCRLPDGDPPGAVQHRLILRAI